MGTLLLENYDTFALEDDSGVVLLELDETEIHLPRGRTYTIPLDDRDDITTDNPNVFIKDPDSKLDYGLDWTEWLESGDSIETLEWTVPSGITEVDSLYNTTSAVIWLSAGTADENYLVLCRITTSAGRIDDRSMRIKVRER